MPTPDNQHEEKALQAPPALVSALRQLPQEPLFIPRTVNERILRAAQQHLGRPAGPKFTWGRLVRWGAATALGMLVLMAIPLFFGKSATKPAPAPALAREDFNHDGRVDILDAFALAQRLRAGPIQELQLDVNGDGRVDEHDVTALAGRAVKLEKGGQS